MDLAIRIVLGLIAILFAAMAMQLMFTPQAAAATFFITPEGAAGLNTIRGDMGGAFAAMALFTAIGLRPGFSRWLLAAAAIVGLIAIGRTIGLISDGLTDSAVSAVATEVVIGALLILGQRRLDRSDPSTQETN